MLDRRMFTLLAATAATLSPGRLSLTFGGSDQGIPVVIGGPRTASAQSISLNEQVWPRGNWETVLPPNVDMDPAKTAAAVKYGSDRGGSGIIVRRGRRVAFWGDQRRKYDLKSTTKSFGSILAALAFKDHRVIPETLVQPLLPELGRPQSSSQRIAWLRQIRIYHLLTHTAGFGKKGGVTDLEFAPASAWSYSDGGPNWVADLLTVLYQRDLARVLRDRVLSPMGIPADRLFWRRNPYRNPLLRGIERREFGSGISSDVDVMARIGLMLLRGGRWGATEILLKEHVDRATTHRPWLSAIRCVDPERCVGSPATDNYGFLFWTNADGHLRGVPRDAFWTHGLGDSFILGIRSLGLVVARAGPGWPESTSSFFAMVAGAAN